MEKLKTSPSPDKPPTGHEKQPTYDDMILDLLIRIYASAKETLSPRNDPDEEAWRDVLVSEIEKHEGELKERNDELRGLIEKEEKEQGSKITSEDIKEGFSSGVSRSVGDPHRAVRVLMLGNTGQSTSIRRCLRLGSKKSRRRKSRPAAAITKRLPPRNPRLLSKFSTPPPLPQGLHPTRTIRNPNRSRFPISRTSTNLPP